MNQKLPWSEQRAGRYGSKPNLQSKEVTLGEAPVERAAFLIDGDAYFSALASTFKRARRFILIAGWRLDSRFRLIPDDASRPCFGDFVHQLVRRSRKLNIYLLVGISR